MNEDIFDEIVVLKDRNVTEDNLRFFLESYFPSRLRESPKSRFLFAYSGHGMSEGPKDHSVGYLLTSSANSFDDKLNSINMSVLRTYIEGVVDVVYQTLVLINASHSGSLFSRQFSINGATVSGGALNLSFGGAHAITAGTSSQQAWADPRLGKGSVFFETLLAGLHGEADAYPIFPDGTRGDGFITVDEIATYLKEEVSWETNGVEIPVLSDLAPEGSLGGFFFINRQRLRVPSGWRQTEPFSIVR